MNKKNAIPKYLNNNFPDYATQSIYIAKTCVNTFVHISTAITYPVKLLDFAGQDLRALFSNERRNDTNLSEHERGVLDYLANSSIIIIVVNLADFVGEPEELTRRRNELILKDVLDMYAADKKHQDIAVVFTAYDYYRVEMEERHGSFEDYVKNELRILWQAMIVGQKSGNSIDVFPVAAVNETEICLESCRRVPKPNSTSFGLERFSDWVLAKVRRPIEDDILAVSQLYRAAQENKTRRTIILSVVSIVVILFFFFAFMFYRNRHTSSESVIRTSPLPSNPRAGDAWTFTMNGVEYSFHWCPSGKFMMGSPPLEENRDSDETQHQVALSQGFWMQETEVTQQMWKSVMGNNPSHFAGEKLPVENVSWNDCQEFINPLNTLNIVPSGYRFSLPTEAQWEYACRAGSTTAYGFGDSPEQLKNYAWYSENSGGNTHEVGTKKANIWGLYDMHGNTWEWCNDWSDTYINDSATDPVEASTGSSRASRGGGWYYFAEDCRSASRDFYAPSYRNSDLGFRVVLVGERK